MPCVMKIITYDEINQSYNTNIFSNFKDMINQYYQQSINILYMPKSKLNFLFRTISLQQLTCILNTVTCPVLSPCPTPHGNTTVSNRRFAVDSTLKS